MNAKRTTTGGLVLAALVAFYTYARPALNDHLGWDLPALGQPTTTVGPAVRPSEPTEPSEQAEPTKAIKPGPLAGRVRKPTEAPKPAEISKSVETSRNGKESAKGVTAESQPSDAPELLHGLLKDLGNERYISPQGLLFTRGSAEGHRLAHLERHTVDDPSRPGKHGVFDGGMPGALKTIDRAYERAKKGQRTTKETDEGRTIYTVDMGSRVGYVGGRDGNRLKKPMARRVRLVLDQNRVITAFPL
jgi:hypothetical protein